jgi:hypothetical protein
MQGKLVCSHTIDCFVISRCMDVCSVIILLSNSCVNSRFVSTVNEHQDGFKIEERIWKLALLRVIHCKHSCELDLGRTHQYKIVNRTVIC